MITKGFILETRKWKNVSLGKVQLAYLNMIAAAPLSAYDIYLHIKKKADIKNVRKTLMKLNSLGLIEVAKGKYPHGAKPYTLTTAGLFQYLLHITVLPYALKQHQNNVLLETLLYQFLEPETLRYFYSIERIELLNRYFKRCCRAITLRFGQYARSRIRKFRIEFLMDDIDRIIMREIKSFIFEIALNCKTEGPQVDFVTWNDLTEGKKLSMAYSEVKGLKGIDFDAFNVSVSGYGPNFRGLYPVQALGRDSKFVKLLKEITKEFMDGSNELLYLTP